MLVKRDAQSSLSEPLAEEPSVDKLDVLRHQDPGYLLSCGLLALP